MRLTGSIAIIPFFLLVTVLRLAADPFGFLIYEKNEPYYKAIPASFK